MKLSGGDDGDGAGNLVRRRRLRYLAVAVVLAGALLVWAWWRAYRPPALHFFAFTDVAGKRCALFTLENGSNDVFRIRSDAEPAQVFTLVKRETGWDAKATPAPAVTPGPEMLGTIGHNWRRNGNLNLWPGDSTRVLVPLPRGKAERDLPIRAAIRLHRYPGESMRWLGDTAPWLTRWWGPKGQDVMVWSETLTP